MPPTYVGYSIADTSVQHLPSAPFEVHKKATLMALAVVLAHELNGIHADHLRHVDQGKIQVHGVQHLAGRTGSSFVPCT
jgi:hypothetical protein